MIKYMLFSGHQCPIVHLRWRVLSTCDGWYCTPVVEVFTDTLTTLVILACRKTLRWSRPVRSSVVSVESTFAVDRRALVSSLLRTTQQSARLMPVRAVSSKRYPYEPQEVRTRGLIDKILDR